MLGHAAAREVAPAHPPAPADSYCGGPSRRPAWARSPWPHRRRRSGGTGRCSGPHLLIATIQRPYFERFGLPDRVDAFALPVEPAEATRCRIASSLSPSARSSSCATASWSRRAIVHTALIPLGNGFRCHSPVKRSQAGLRPPEARRAAARLTQSGSTVPLKPPNRGPITNGPNGLDRGSRTTRLLARRLRRDARRGRDGPRPARTRRCAGCSTAAAAPSWSAPRRVPRTARSTRSTSGATTSSGGSTGWSASQRPLVEKMTLFWHDHFATRDQDTPLLLRPEPACCASTRSATSRRCCARSRATTRCSLFLSLFDSSKWAPNENYARELMELFSPRQGLHGERHPRGGARADRLPRHAGRRRLRRHPTSTRSATTPASSASSASAASYDWRDVIDIVLAHRNARAVPRRQALELLRHRSRSTLPRRRGSCGSTARRSSRSSRSSPRSSRHPKLYANLDRPDMVKSPLVFLAGTLRTTGARRRALVVDLAARRHGPDAVPPAVGRRLGLGSGVAVDQHDEEPLPGGHLPDVDDGPLSVPDGSTPIDLSPAGRGRCAPGTASASRGSPTRRATP